MTKWFRSVILFMGFALLLYHNVTAHHHDDDNDSPAERAQQHHNGPLERVKVEHQFYPEYRQDFVFTVADFAVTPPLVYLPKPALVLLPKVSWLITKEPHPPAWYSNQTILRGPPANC